MEALESLDVLIITIPISEKSCCISSLYNRIQNLSAFIGDFKGQMFLMSSTGVYPDMPKEFHEEDVPVEKVSGERMVKNKYPQVNILRLGGLMGITGFLKIIMYLTWTLQLIIYIIKILPVFSQR
jgi:hypothetical protein